MVTPASSNALSGGASTYDESSWHAIMEEIKRGNKQNQKLVSGIGQRVKSIEESQLHTGRILADGRQSALEAAGQHEKVDARYCALRVEVDGFLPMKDDGMIKLFENALYQSAIESAFYDTTDKVIFA
jgi:hypothetical protein